MNRNEMYKVMSYQEAGNQDKLPGELNEQLLIREQSAHAQIEIASRMKDEFLARLSHEIRSPLNSILGWVSLLRNGKLSDEESKQALEVIERNARAQNSLINNMLDVSSAITGKLRLNVQPMMPERIIQTCVDLLQPAVEAKNIQLQIELDSQAGPVSADADRLRQIVWNLLVNAIKFTPKGGHVRVNLRRVRSQVEIAIRDNGVGIEPKMLPFIFDRFRQDGGLGLGLAIVRYLVELHGGTVQAESAGANSGATFTVRLPLLAAPRAAGGDRWDLDYGAKLADLRVLVVEDDRDSRQLMLVIFSPCRADVRVAANPVEALEMLQDWRPDIIVSDIEMPMMNGLEFIRALRQREDLAGIPAVALTANARMEDRLLSLAAGFQMHLTKPVEPAELLAVVASLTGRINSSVPAVEKV